MVAGAAGGFDRQKAQQAIALLGQVAEAQAPIVERMAKSILGGFPIITANEA